MTSRRWVCCLFAGLLCGFASGADATAQQPPVDPITLHSGMCDASAAVELAPGIFLAANDEDNLLRAYRTGLKGPPLLVSTALTDYHATPAGSPEHAEADLEGCARAGDRPVVASANGEVGERGLLVLQ